MRCAAQFDSETTARLYMRVLYGQSIDCQLGDTAPAFDVWVLDDDHLEQAKSLADELKREGNSQFEANHKEVFKQADLRDKQREAKLKSRATQIVDMRTQGFRKNSFAPYVTALIIGLTAMVAINTYVGEDRTPLYHAMLIADSSEEIRVYENTMQGVEPWKTVRVRQPDGSLSEPTRYVPLREIHQGEVWRLITPIFLHFGIWHLLFNVMWVVSMATQIERLQGHGRVLFLTLLFAITSNYAQYQWGTVHQDFGASINFGGLSGVISGYVMYVWMQSRYNRRSGLYIDEQNIVLFLIWNVLCLSGAVGSIANGAHLGGLVVGLIAGVSGPMLEKWKRDARMSKYKQ